MMKYKFGDVLIKKNHVSRNGYKKDRWVILAGQYERYNSKYYILFYCTKSELSFPNAVLGCNHNDSDNYYCYVFDKLNQEFEYKTYVSLLQPARYDLELMSTEVENTSDDSGYKFVFSLDPVRFNNLLDCAIKAKSLKAYIIQALQAESSKFQNQP